MKRLSLLFVSVFLSALCHAQQVSYSYDEAGNRVSRQAGNGSQAPRRSSVNQQQASLENAISVGPNPTTGPLEISLLRYSENDECHLTLTNTAGQVLINNSMTSAKTTLDLSPYAYGFYLLKIDLNGEQKSYKIIKK